MNERSDAADSLLGSQDAGFGVYTANDQFSNYASWTQFSGIPQTPPSEDAAMFGWESFVTPPNTPAAGHTDMNSQNYFAELNKMMNVMGKTNAANFDSSSNDTDKLASTPLAQSLLEALNSTNPVMNTSPPAGIPMQHPMDFDVAGQEGYDMYAEALKKYGSEYDDSYTPFGSSEILNSSPSVSPQPTDWDKNGTASLKPSYSEVAKTFKSQGSEKDRDDSDLTKRRSIDSQTSRSFKGNKKFLPRQRGRNSSVPDDMRTTVSPDSKYGLDDFGDLGKSTAEKDESGSGLDSIPLTRRNSTSSLSSGTSGIEEIHLPKSCNNFSNVSSEPQKYEKISNKEKEKTMDQENVKNVGKEEKPFFDARRIFQTKDTNKRRGQSGQTKLSNEDAEPMILNNGKPSYSQWGSSSHRKSTHYINNNLRDSQKKTNQNTSSGKDAETPEDTGYSQGQGRTEKRGKPKSNSSSKPKMPLQTSFDHELIGKCTLFVVGWSS